MVIHYYYNESRIVLITTLNQETTLNFLKNRSKRFLSEQPLWLGLSHQPLGHLWILSSDTLSLCTELSKFWALPIPKLWGGWRASRTTLTTWQQRRLSNLREMGRSKGISSSTRFCVQRTCWALYAVVVGAVDGHIIQCILSKLGESVHRTPSRLWEGLEWIGMVSSCTLLFVCVFHFIFLWNGIVWKTRNL